MMDTQALPYPPNPDAKHIPKGLTDFSSEYVRLSRKLMYSAFLFLLLYLACTILLAFVGYWWIIGWKHANFVSMFLGAVCWLLVIFLVKNIFKTPPIPKELLIEIQPKQHPNLFRFLHRLCDDIGVDYPQRVLISPYVNAGVYTPVSLRNLFVRPSNDLILGLGLVNAVNLSEFKAVLAHEFGHFSQPRFVVAYAQVVQKVIHNIVIGQDFTDRLITFLNQVGGLALLISMPIQTGVELIRGLMQQTFKALLSQRMAAMREGEFHADLVAASLAGSDATTLCLFRTGFGAQTLSFAFGELRKAADHKYYTSDLYYHQSALEGVVRKRYKDTTLGERPKLTDPFSGQDIQVFDPDQTIDPAEYDDYHPSDSDREENIKRHFIPAEMDTRSPWILFTNPEGLRKQVTSMFYREVVKISKMAVLLPATDVQTFLDIEEEEITFDARYQSVYDDRWLDLDDLEQLQYESQDKPWPTEKLIEEHTTLYNNLKARADEHKELCQEYDRVTEQARGSKAMKSRKILKKLEDQIEQSNSWFRSLDQKVFQIHFQMALRLDAVKSRELLERYRFHMAIQQFFKSARYHQVHAHFTLQYIFSQQEIDQDDFGELMHVLREARSALRRIQNEARELNMPAMKHFEEGIDLADFLLPGKLVSELPETFVRGKWIDKLMMQLDEVRSRSSRLHYKSLGSILRLQEEITAEFLEKRPHLPETKKPHYDPRQYDGEEDNGDVYKLR